MDSLDDADRLAAAGVALHPVPEQDSTDLEKCLHSIDAPLYLGVGFLGGRVDHELAALNALARCPGKRLILIGRGDLCFRCPERGTRMMAKEGDRVSFFPFGATRGAHSIGLRWPVTGLDFAPDGRVGTSNAALGGPLEARFEGGPMVVILPRRYLGQAVADHD